MKSSRYISAACLVVAVGIVAFLEVPLWAKAVALAWIGSPLVVNAFLGRKKGRIAAELASHSSNSVQDRTLHAYRERA
jgi:hypothetical protein